MFNSKGRYVRQSQVEKFTRYSIRRLVLVRLVWL